LKVAKYESRQLPLPPLAKESLNFSPADFGIITTGIVTLSEVSFLVQTIL